MWTLQDAKNRFSAVVDAALSGAPQKVSRRGKPAVVVLAAADYQWLLDAAKARRASFADHILAFPTDDDLSGISRLTARPRDVTF